MSAIQSMVRESKLDKMETFERDCLNTGVLEKADLERHPEDETKWVEQRVDRFYRLWLAGARYAQDGIRASRVERE